MALTPPRATRAMVAAEALPVSGVLLISSADGFKLKRVAADKPEGALDRPALPATTADKVAPLARLVVEGVVLRGAVFVLDDIAGVLASMEGWLVNMVAAIDDILGRLVFKCIPVVAADVVEFASPRCASRRCSNRTTSALRLRSNMASPAVAAA
jgi:hypothetical protein